MPGMPTHAGRGRNLKLQTMIFPYGRRGEEHGESSSFENFPRRVQARVPQATVVDGTKPVRQTTWVAVGGTSAIIHRDTGMGSA